MKKTVIVTVCVLLFCLGLFCIHLTAQPNQHYPNGISGALVFDGLDGSQATSLEMALTLLLDRKLEECSERELLELKVAVYRKLAHYTITGSSVIQLAEARANLAAAQIELYRHTGEQHKVLAAIQLRVEALTDKLRAVSLSHKSKTILPSILYETELQLLDALLEQKRAAALGNVP